MTVSTPYRSDRQAGHDRFAGLLRAEWTKFRTVRGWVIGVLVAILVTAGIGLAASGGSSSSCQQVGSNGPARSGAACGPSFPVGPNGAPVSDSFYFVHQRLGPSGTVTARVTSLTGQVPAGSLDSPAPAMGPGLEEWAKAGIIIKSSSSAGSAYAAMMVAAGHGVRMQWDYSGDTPGLAGAVGPADPRWLRLTRSGDVITGYDSADGTHWTEVGRVTLAGLPPDTLAGLFAASPDFIQETQSFGGGNSGNIGPTQATAVIDNVSGLPGPWTGGYIGGDYSSGSGGFHQSGGTFTVTGSGDIAPIVAGHGGAADSAATVTDYLLGTFAGLIALVVVATMFMTAEYRRQLIRVTLAASPRRGRVLAAKAVVAAAVSFVAGIAAAAVAVLAGSAITRARGYFFFPVPAPTEARVIIGTGLLAAVAAVLALGIGTMVRRSAAAVTIVIVAIVLPYFVSVAAVVPLSAADWLLRITPAAGFAAQQAYPHYPQVNGIYSVLNGYFPLAWWAGLLVLGGWAAAAMAAAVLLLRRRDT
jgi:ABC-type transport system involved in multi-copper enzyme maturation permease subunit